MFCKSKVTFGNWNEGLFSAVTLSECEIRPLVFLSLLFSMLLVLFCSERWDEVMDKLIVGG